MSHRFTRILQLAAVLIMSSAVYGQEVRATVTGTVTDPTGAAVAGAIVTVTNSATNASVATKTNESGNYVTPFLAPGRYVVTVAQPGFKKFVHEDVVLESLDKARVDVQLEIGITSDSVLVSSQVSVLQTETATRGQTISSEMLTMGRNPFQLAWSAPGIVKTGSFRYLRAFDIGGTSGFSVNGGKNQENEVLLDGISDVQASRQVIGVPTIDSVQEFKVLTNTYDAQYGRTGGGIVTIVTKGGSNELHGNAFEYPTERQDEREPIRVERGRNAEISQPHQHDWVSGWRSRIHSQGLRWQESRFMCQLALPNGEGK